MIKAYRNKYNLIFNCIWLVEQVNGVGPIIKFHIILVLRIEEMQKKKINKCATIKVPAFHTYLVEQYIEITQQIKISLLSGSAEIFGLQLKLNYPHTYSVPASIPIFTWEGAQLRVQWTQYEGIKNSEQLWMDITQHSQKNYHNVHYSTDQSIGYSTPMIEYLELSYNFIQSRKCALQNNKYGPVVAVVGDEFNAPQNVSKLLLNYSGKYSMNPIFIDLDPENSSIFINGSIGALEFEYKILEDLYDRPDKICFYYGNRCPREPSFSEVATLIKDSIRKKLFKQRKEFIEHGSNEQYPSFVSGIIIQCPKIKEKRSQPEQYQLINKILEIFEVTHIVSVENQNYLDQVPKKIKAEKIKTRALEGTESFLGLPRPIKSKIERYFGGESKRRTYKAEDVSLYEIMAETPNNKVHCRKIEISQQAISKNTVSILHAFLQKGENLDKFQMAQKALKSPICYLLHIFSIQQGNITFQAPAESIFDDYKDNIWVTSVE